MKITVKDLFEKMGAYAEAMHKTQDLEFAIEDAKQNEPRLVPQLEAQLAEAKAKELKLGKVVV